jgi:hypothetical protein
MRDGIDLNQHGQGALQEHASSSSPETLHGVGLSTFFASRAPTWEIDPEVSRALTIIELSSIKVFIVSVEKR